MSESYNIKGIVKKIYDPRTIGEKGFKITEFVIEIEDGKYPQHILLQMTGDQGEHEVSRLNVGQSVSVDFNLRGRESSGRFWNTLLAWKIARLDQGQVDKAFPPKVSRPQKEDDADELPF